MKKSNKLSATSLRTILRAIVGLIIVLAIAGFYFTQNWLSNYATQTNKVPDSSADNASPQALNKIQTEVARNQAYGDKASSMIASSQNYQSQAVKDLNKYASSAGVSIASYSLSQPTTSINPIGGLKSGFVTITMDNPVQLKNLLKFFKYIETNLPAMQLTGINITPSQSLNGTVSVQPLIIEVYTR